MPERHSLLAKTARAVRFSQPAGSRDIVSPYLRVAIMTAVGESQLQWAARPHAKGLAGAAAAPVLDVVVPVYNEERALGPSIRRLHRYLREHFPLAARITIADNASVDATPCIAADLAEELDGVRVLRLEHKGRGRALQAAWSRSDSPVLAYMDVDLSTDLAALAPLIAPLISGHSDLAIGTRLGPGARVVRGAKREIISRCYNVIVKSTLAARFSDAQCGFKAIRADVAAQLLPHVADTGWFFDTELLVLAQRAGLRIHEVPVDWVDNPDSRVELLATAVADLKGIARLLRGFLTGSIPVNAIAEQLDSRRAAPPRSLLRQAVRFGAVGIASTAAYLLLFALLRGPAGAQPANLLALLLTAVANTAANRRFTFGVRGRAHLTRHHGEGLVVFGIALAITSAALARAACAGRNVARARGDRAGRGQPGRHRHPVRAASRMGVPPAPRHAHRVGSGVSAPATAVADPPAGDRPADSSGRERIKRWERPAMVALLAATAAFWLFGLSRNGWANSFYSAAVQAATRSWKALLFGSSDAGNSITVDKPPAGLWPMDISARVFGVSSWSILVPQVVLGVASVAVLYAIVSKRFGAAAGLIAGFVLAVTPVATLMFRYNNPDALLVFLIVAAAWALLRAVDDGRTRWLVCAGALTGLGFLTKQLQVMLVVPALVVTYLVAGPVRLRTRVWQLLAALAALVVAAGWWVLLVSVVPASQRPYVGGSTDNSFIELTFGYNGLSRLTGHRPGASAGFSGGHGFSFGSHAGALRLFTGESGAQISWLLPAALIFAAIGLLWCGRAARTDAHRAQYLLWGGWLVVAGAVLSFMSGTFHDYYTVVLAPPVAALAGIGTTQLWMRRDSARLRWMLLALTAAGTAVWSWILLGRAPGFAPPLRWIVLIAGGAAAVALVAALRGNASRFAVPAAALAAAAALAGPVAYSIQTVATAHAGGIVNAGPPLPGARNGGRPGMPAGREWPGMGQTAVSAQIKQLLSDNAADYTWVAATNGANEAAGYQLGTGEAVMPIGGFSARDPAPTLAQFQRYVAEKHIHYYIEGRRTDRSGGWGADSAPAEDQPHTVTEADKIGDWVKHTFTPRIVDGVTVYDLTRPEGAGAPGGI